MRNSDRTPRGIFIKKKKKREKEEKKRKEKLE